MKAKLPSDGTILGATTVEFYEGDTVYSALSRVCTAKNIPITATESTYGVYVSSIDNLSEKYYDYSTGWCYTVNGNYPTESANYYTLKDGDTVTWQYDSWSF